MPASDISRLSISGAPRCDMAIKSAKEMAQRHVGLMIRNGLLRSDDTESIKREYSSIYKSEYYRYYAHFLSMEQQHQSRVIFLPTENPSARKYYVRHAAVRFSRLNNFIHAHRDCITVGRINFPIDENLSPETKEAFLSYWPGPLDQPSDTLKRAVTNYIDTLWQHDSQRRIRYTNGYNDGQRKTILKLLTELLHRNGTIDAPCITRHLLRPEETEIQKDENKPFETLQKYLLLGKRNEAIKFAKSRQLWDHALCLAFLDKYQPPNTDKYIKDGMRLRDDSIVQLNYEFISATEQNILNTVYRSLLNRILQSDPESINIVKHPNVANKPYEFAILSANDCEMEFDQSNETFKLIVSMKQAISNPALAKRHLISLGLQSMDSHDPSDNFSHLSHISFKNEDTSAIRTLTISNIDMLILNEIWEYCLNLANNTCNPINYDYLLDLVPYKIVFASKLLDFGLHKMFANYLSSIKNALSKARGVPDHERDQSYDWDTIERSVEHMSKTWEIYCMSNIGLNLANQDYKPPTPVMESVPAPMASTFNLPPALQPQNSLSSLPIMNNQLGSMTDYTDSSQFDYPSLPYQHQNVTAPGLSQNYISSTRGRNIPQPIFNQFNPIQEAVTDFSPDPELGQEAQRDDRNTYDQQPSYNDYSYNDNSRRPSQSYDVGQINSPPSFGLPNSSQDRGNQPKTMNSSSPVHKGRDSLQSNHEFGDSFKSPFSPINQSDDLANTGGLEMRPAPQSTAPPPPPPPQMSDARPRPGSSFGLNDNSNNSISNTNPGNQASSSGTNSKSQQPTSDQQQTGLLSNLFGSAKALLPKSNSKQMILPDDSEKKFVYDDERGRWVDTTKPEEADGGNQMDAPPMMMDSARMPTYSYAVKSSKARYPRV